MQRKFFHVSLRVAGSSNPGPSFLRAFKARLTFSGTARRFPSCRHGRHRSGSLYNFGNSCPRPALGRIHVTGPFTAEIARALETSASRAFCNKGTRGFSRKCPWVVMSGGGDYAQQLPLNDRCPVNTILSQTDGPQIPHLQVRINHDAGLGHDFVDLHHFRSSLPEGDHFIGNVRWWSTKSVSIGTVGDAQQPGNGATPLNFINCTASPPWLCQR